MTGKCIKKGTGCIKKQKETGTEQHMAKISSWVQRKTNKTTDNGSNLAETTTNNSSNDGLSTTNNNHEGSNTSEGNHRDSNTSEGNDGESDTNENGTNGSESDSSNPSDKERDIGVGDSKKKGKGEKMEPSTYLLWMNYGFLVGSAAIGAGFSCFRLLIIDRECMSDSGGFVCYFFFLALHSLGLPLSSAVRR